MRSSKLCSSLMAVGIMCIAANMFSSGDVFAKTVAESGLPAAKNNQVQTEIVGDLNGTSWKVKSVRIKPNKKTVQRVSRKHKADVSFANGVFSGHDGCNSFFGLYVQNRDRLFTFPRVQTLLGCSGKRGADANAVTIATSDKLNLTFKGTGKLKVIRNPDARSVWVKTDCPGCKNIKLPEMDKLKQARWQIRSVNLWEKDGFLKPNAYATFTDTDVAITNECGGITKAGYRYDLKQMKFFFDGLPKATASTEFCKTQSDAAFAQLVNILSDNPGFSLVHGESELLIASYAGSIWMERERKRN